MKRGRKQRIEKANHSKNKLPDAKNTSEWVEYLNTRSMQMCPANDQYFERFAFELMEWARDCPVAYYPEQFCILKEICESTYYTWVNKYPCIKAAHEAALMHLAIRNEIYLRERDPASVKYVMPQLSKRWMKEDERRAAQREKQSDSIFANSVIKVNVSPIEETSEVDKQLKKKKRK